MCHHQLKFSHLITLFALQLIELYLLRIWYHRYQWKVLFLWIHPDLCFESQFFSLNYLMRTVYTECLLQQIGQGLVVLLAYSYTSVLDPKRIFNDRRRA